MTPPELRPEAHLLHRRCELGRRGSIAVYVAIASLVLIGVVGLTIDTAYTTTARMELQGAADAAALAGAAKIQAAGQTSYNLVRQAAVDAAKKNAVVGCCPTGVVLDPNPGNVATGDVVVGKWKLNGATGTYSFDPLDPTPDAVQVRARCATGALNPPLQLFFGPVFGQATSEGGRSSIARLGSTEDPLFVILNPAKSGAFAVSSTPTVDVSAGSIQVNSSNACALTITSTSTTVTAQKTKVVGHACPNGKLKGTLIELAPSLPDPLASLPEPSSSGMTSLPAITAAGTYNPGYYPTGIKLTSGAVTLNSGIYIIGNQSPGVGVDISSSSSITGTGVMLFLQSGARLKTAGAATLTLTPPTSGTYSGITFFKARANTTADSIRGSGAISLQGTLYLAGANFDTAGTGTRTFGRMVADTLTIAGSSKYTMTGVGSLTLGHKYVFLAQ